MQTYRGKKKRMEQKSDLVAGTTPKHEAWQDKLVWYKGRQGLFRKEGRAGENNREKERQGDTGDTDKLPEQRQN